MLARKVALLIFVLCALVMSGEAWAKEEAAAVEADGQTYRVSGNLKIHGRLGKKLNEIDFENARCVLNEVMPEDFTKFPDAKMKKDFKAQFDWFERTPEGRAAYQKRLRWHKHVKKTYWFKLSKDGTFDFSGLPAGRYDLIVEIKIKDKGQRVTKIDLIGMGIFQSDKVYLDTNSADEKKHLRLKDYRVYPDWKLDVGQVMPPLRLKGIDGKVVDLAAYRGKFVILDFWALWCGPCLAETPFLKQVYEKYGRQGKLEIVGVSVDKKVADVKQYNKKQGIVWPTACIGGDKALTQHIEHRFGVSGYPTMHLIDPKGRYIEHVYRGGGVEKQLARWFKMYEERREDYERYIQMAMKQKAAREQEDERRVLLK